MASTRVGTRVRAIRTKAGVTQRELADRARLHVMYVSKLERGERDNPTIDTLRAIARALRCSISELTGESTRAA